jgi:hypothetical protein
MLAQRGMSASTVGRDALFNAIIQSAMPIAQSNAQAIQASVGQQKNIEAQEAEANAARGQQTASRLMLIMFSKWIWLSLVLTNRSALSTVSFYKL